MRTGKISRKGFSLTALILSSMCVFFIALLSATNASCKDGNEWIAFAELSCIPADDFTVEVETEVVTDHTNKLPESGPGLSQGARKTRMKYSEEKGLRLVSSKGGASFTVDVASMLKKMKGKVEWIIEKNEEIVNDKPAVVVSSSGKGWLVRLWISHANGTVLRYDQYLNGRHISTSKIDYSEKTKGVHLPIKIETELHPPGEKIVQNYSNYVFEGGEK